MRFHCVLATSLLFGVTALHAQRDYEPDLKGYVTRITSPVEMDVNGTHIRIDSGTQFFTKAANKLSRTQFDNVTPYIGQPVEVYGKRHDKEHSIEAKQINLRQNQAHKVQGSGVVDAVPHTSPLVSSPEGLLLRADGYLVIITKQTEQTFEPPMTASSAPQTNVWMSFHGTQRADGVVVATDVSFRLNTVGEREEKVRARTEHDPATVHPAAEQSATSMAFRGVDPRRIPPYKDETMQSRVSSIGERLVPKYQRELAATDRTKLNFRFQVVEEENVPFSFSWPDGTILVPRDVVERLKDDSQLAAVLADGIANILEKHPFGLAQTGKKRLAGKILAVASPLDTLYSLSRKDVSFGANSREDLEQSGRVSLCLMRDAGYDVNQAPLAWWLLADTNSKGLDKTPLPARSEYLYKFLGETSKSQ